MPPPNRRLTLVPPPVELAGVASGNLEPMTAEDLEEAELRLLARYAVGDHIPVEVRENVALMRRARAATPQVP